MCSGKKNSVCFEILNQIELFGINSNLWCKIYVCQVRAVSKSIITGQCDFTNKRT